jgi:hypothetical protein
MPEGSSSAAPVINPGPRQRKNLRREPCDVGFAGASEGTRCICSRFAQRVGFAGAFPTQLTEVRQQRCALLK